MAKGDGVQQSIDQVQLIEAVRSFPCLWEISSRDYKDTRARDNAWKSVAEVVGDTPGLCSKKQKNRTCILLHAAFVIKTINIIS